MTTPLTPEEITALRALDGDTSVCKRLLLPRALDTIEAQAVEIEKAGEVARTMRDCLREANEKIEAQAKEIGVLREVLRPLAGIADTMSRESGVPDAQISNDVWVSVRLGQCRRARAALAKEKVDG
jgi:hypothetical protein